MTPRPSGSRKPSAASSTVTRLEEVVFYLDESIFSRVLLNALRAAGARVEHVRGAVKAGSDDAEWLSVAGEHRWIVLMRDQRIRYRRLEREALESAEVGAFVFTGGQATAQDTADVIVPRLSKIVSIARSELRPFLYTLTLGGTLSRVPL